jgi:DNA-binding NtrC family response regulator
MNNSKDNRPSVLIVDDDKEVLDLFRSTLKRRNYKFFSSSSYEGASDYLDMKKLDLLVVDLYLGGGEQTGLKLASRARQFDKNIQVIIISDRPDADSVKEAVEIDVYDYLKKPIQAVAISRSCARAIEKRLLLDERDELKSYVDEINTRLKDSETRFLKFTEEFKTGRFEVEERLEATRSELKKAVQNIKPVGVEKDGK